MQLRLITIVFPLRLILDLNYKKTMKTQTQSSLKLSTLVCSGLLSVAAVSPAVAETDNAPTAQEPLDLAPVSVIGSRDNVDRLPGSGAFLDIDDIRTQNYDNVDQVVRQVPGVYFRTEDGFGLFPNVSMRGVGSMRTTKVTVMEDGILTAPAPYAAPAAYYFPTLGRAAGVEILKGSSQVRYGPQTTGGVFNMQSTPIPTEQSGFFRGLYGTDNEIRAHAWLGDSFDTNYGRVGILVENYYRASDGFKTIDQVGNRAPGDTGFRLNEPMLKVSFEPNSAVDQRFEAKIGYTDMTADETYLGLSEEDFRNDPFRRYSSTREDVIPTEHFRTYLRHSIRPDDESELISTAYFNDFSRAWFKLNEVSTDVATDSSRPGGANRRNLSEALAENGDHLEVLRGEREGTLRYRDNNREYRAYGLDLQYGRRFETGELDHHLSLGARIHHDYEDRFQNETNFVQDGSGEFGSGGTFTSAPGSQANRKSEATAYAFWIDNQMEWDRLTLTPGLRYEHVRFKRTDRDPSGNTVRRSSIDVFAPGIGGTYALTDQTTLLAGVFRGFSVPGAGSAAAGGLKEETSTSFEIGIRDRRENTLRSELIFFWTEFDDLIVIDNQGAGGVTGNAGKARSLGFEASLRGDFGEAMDWNIGLPSYLSFTYTDATLRSNDNAGGGGGGAVESIFAGGTKGNKLPYIPEFQIAFGTGIEWERVGLYADAFYVDSTFGTANNTDNLRRGENADGPLDSRFGKSDSYFLLDLSVKTQVSESTQVFAGMQNALDREYLASRIPHGPRPGAPRFAYAGLEMQF